MELVRDLARTLCEAHPEEAARVLEELDAPAVADCLATLPAGAAARVLSQMARLRSAGTLEHLDPKTAGVMLDTLPLDDAARCLQPLSPEARATCLAHVAKKAAEGLETLLRSPQGTAGALMDPRALALPEDCTVGEALTRVRDEARFLRHYLYVVRREDGRLVGVASLRMLLVAEPEIRLSSLMAAAEERISANAGVAAILAHPGWRRFPVMPVVADGGVFAGAIRYEVARRHAVEAEVEDDLRGTMTTVASLGELWWIGFAGMFAGLTTPVTPSDRASGRRR